MSTRTLPQAPRALACGIVAAAVVATLSADAANAASSAIWLHYLCKPLATLLILWWAWRARPPVNLRYRTAVVAGIAFSACGDIFLMLPDRTYSWGFMGGLGSFLIAHLCFLRALTSDVPWFGKPQAPLGFAALAGVNLFVLWDGIPVGLRGPVLAYVACLAAMAAQAASRWLSLRTGTGRLAAGGGALFFLSDTLIAYNRFYRPLAAAEICILGSYYAALWLIAASVADDKAA